MALKGKILPETSTIIKQDIPYIAGPKREGMPFSEMKCFKKSNFRFIY